ncbi:MAG: winged helix-turn-helix domain-containing protein [Chloroflexota bacterium]
MNQEPNFATLAALIGDPTRASILSALLGGVALPASELARRAHVTPQTVSAHLGKLLEGGLIRVTKSGRHRYYTLADARIAGMLETLQTLAPLPSDHNGRRGISDEMAGARTCYDHLAGRLGVAVTDALVSRAYIEASEGAYHISDVGEALFAAWEIDVGALRAQRRKFAYPCLDWSERRHHIAGALGAAIAAHFIEVGWVRRREGTRSLLVTGVGAAALWTELGVSLPEAATP